MTFSLTLVQFRPNESIEVDPQPSGARLKRIGVLAAVLQPDAEAIDV
jgi:hypothetical protein